MISLVYVARSMVCMICDTSQNVSHYLNVNPGCMLFYGLYGYDDFAETAGRENRKRKVQI